MSDNGESAREPQVETSQGGETAAPSAATTSGASARPGSGKVQRRALPRTTRDNEWASGSGIESAAAPPPDDPRNVHAAAAEGAATPGGPLPHRGQLESAFGLDLSSIVAHTGPEAQETSRAMGANAYATGNHVVVPPGAGVGLVAHEVTHVLQQEQGVHLSGGVDGGASDPLEQQADAVGAAVERGESVARHFSDTGAAPAGGRAVQRMVVQRDAKKPPEPPPPGAGEMDAKLNEIRVMKAQAGLAQVAKRWKDELPTFFDSVSDEVDVAVPVFRQKAFNLLVQEKIDVAPVREVLKAPGREKHAAALTEAEQVADFDRPQLEVIRDDVKLLIAGGQLQRLRQRLMVKHAQLSPWGKRAVRDVAAFGVADLDAYAGGEAKSHGKLEESYLDSGSWSFGEDEARMEKYGQGEYHRPIAIRQIVSMLREKAPALETTEESSPAGQPKPDAEENVVDRAQANELEAHIVAAVKEAEAAPDRQLGLGTITLLEAKIAGITDGARDLVWANTALVARLVAALDPKTAERLIGQMDPVARLYDECKKAAEKDDEEQKYQFRVKFNRMAGYAGHLRLSEDQVEARKFGKDSGVFQKLRGWLRARPSEPQKSLRKRLLEHTKLKDDFIDRLQLEENRIIHRLIQRGSEDRTAEDKLFEAIEDKDGAGAVMGLRELAGTRPDRIKELETDMVFRTGMGALTDEVKLPDGATVRPWHVALLMWGIEPGEASDPGTVKLTEVNRTGNTDPLTIQQRHQLESQLFVPCLREIRAELTGENLDESTTTRGDQEMSRDRTRQFLAKEYGTEKGDPQAIQNILVTYDRRAASPDFVELLQREGLVFGNEIQKRYYEQYGVDLRTWVYQHSGPVNRSGSSRVLGLEQGSSVGMLNGRVVMAGEMDQKGKMTLHQALREHASPRGSASAMPIYEWGSVWSRRMHADLGNKEKLLKHWTEFCGAVEEVRAEIEAATGIRPIRAIDLIRNAYLEHSGHFETNLLNKWKGKPDDYAAIKQEMGIVEGLDRTPDAPAPSISEQAEKNYGEAARLLWQGLQSLHFESEETQYSAAAALMQARFLPRIPEPSRPVAEQQVAPTNNDQAAANAPATVDERPPKSFSAYYRVQYGSSPELHAAAVIRMIGKSFEFAKTQINWNAPKRKVSAERAAEIFQLPVGMVTGAVAIPEEDGSIDKHNRHLIHASFKESTAKEVATQLWTELVNDGRMSQLQTILGKFNDEEQRLIKIQFRRLSGGYDLTFYLRQLVEARKQAVEARRGGYNPAPLQYGIGIAAEGTSEAEGLDKRKTAYSSFGGEYVSNDVGHIVSGSSDAELDQMLAISMQGELSVADRIRAAIKRDSDGELVRVIDELTVEERRQVLKNGALLSEIHGQLGQYNYERAFKVLTGQGDLADRLYSRSHGGSWWERKVWGGTDESGMRQDIQIYIRHLRLQHNKDVRDEVTRMLNASGDNRAPDQEAIDKEVNRRVGAACAKIASDKSVKAIMDAELDKDEKAEMEAMIAGGGSTALEWALAGGEGKAKILADINAMTPQQRRERLDNPTYMRMLGQRVTSEKDYRDLVNALKQGLDGGDGLSKLDEATRTGAQVQGGDANQDKAFAALGALSPQEFARLKQDPVLQAQVLRAVKPENQQLVRDYLAGPEGAVPVEALVRKPVAPPAAPPPGAEGPAPAPAQGPAQDPAPAPGQAPDPAAAAEERKKAEEAARQKNIQFLVHQATHRLRFPLKTARGWSIVLEQAVEVAKSPLPKQAPTDAAQAAVEPGQPAAANPRQLVWDSIANEAWAYGAVHDAQRSRYQTTTSLTSQDLTGTDMQAILKAAVVEGVDPSEHLIAAKIMTTDEMLTPKERELGVRLMVPGRADDHVVKEDDIKDALNSASDEIIISRWTTHMAGPPGAKDGPTLKKVYDSFVGAREKARPTIEQEERKAREAKAAKAAAQQPAPSPTVAPVSGGGDAAIDAAAKQGKQQFDWDRGVQQLSEPDEQSEQAPVAEAALKKREFLEFQANVSSVFEAMLRQWVGDSDTRQLTPEGSYKPDQVRTASTGNKRYQNFVETLLARIPNLNPEVIATLLGMAPEDRWMVKSNMRQEGAMLALTEEKNLRFGGAQRKENGVASEEYQQFQLQRYLYTRMFAGVTTDGVVDGGEKEQLEYRRSENDRTREAYKVALETSAMWASLITSVLVTIAATILTGGLALGPMGMLAIGGITCLLSAHAQAAVNKEILQDEFDDKDKRELITREVVTGLVTLGTTYYAQRLISVVGKIPSALGQANAARQVLGKPPTLWSTFLREASEEGVSELAQTYVDAGLEAANPEHWVDGFTEGAKQSKQAVDRILSTADERAFTGALTSLVTAGVSRGRGAARRRRGKNGQPDTYEFDAPTEGRKRQVNMRKNLREAFGDPEEKFSGALIEWAVQQAMNGQVDWANAPEQLLQGLLQEYKEVGTERFVRDAQAGGRNRRVDRHLAINKGFLNDREQAEYERVARTADDTAPFMTVQDFARVRAEVAMTGMSAWETQNDKRLTSAQREAFIEYVRNAENNEELYRRAKEDPLSISSVKNADVGEERVNQQIGFALGSEATARQVVRDLADGRADSLRRLGIEPPADFDPTQNEWGLGRRTDPVSGEVSYILVRGTAGAVDWSGLPNVEAIGHSHPNLASNQLKNLDPNGSVAVADLIATPGPDRVHFLPSGGDLVFVEANRVSEHTVFTPFQSHGNGRVGNAVPGSGRPGVNIVIRNAERVGDLFGNPDMPVVRAEVEVRAGNEILWTGPIWGAHHPSAGSAIYHHEPTEHMDVRRPGAGDRDLTGTTASERQTVQIDQVAPHERPTGQFPAVNVDESNAPPLAPHERPTGQFPAVNVDESNAPPAAPDVVVNPPQVVKVKRDAASVATDFPQLAHTAALPAGALFGAHHRARAELALQKMSDEDFLAMQRLVREQTSPLAQGFLFKALAAGNSVADVKWLAGQIAGQPDDWLLDNLTLGDPRQVGVGTVQQWSMSCNASMTLTLRGNYDPVFALNFRLRNTDVADVNYDDPTQHNTYQADLEKQMLERAYPGGGWGQDARHGGQARPRGDQNAALGRGADDLLNDIDTLGMKFDTQFVASPGAAIPSLDRALMQGLQVPVVIGDERINTAHYILAMARREDNGFVEYQFHDTANGKTVWVSQADILRGTMPFGFGRIYGLEVPSSAPTQAVIEGGDAADRRPAGPRPDAAPGMARRNDQGTQRVVALKKALKGVKDDSHSERAREALDAAIAGADLAGPQAPFLLEGLRSQLTEREMSQLLIHLTKQQVPANVGTVKVEDDWQKSAEQEKAVAAARGGDLTEDQRKRLVAEINRQVPDVALTKEVQQNGAKSVVAIVMGGQKQMNDDLIGYQLGDSDLIPQRQKVMHDVFKEMHLTVVEQTYKTTIVASTLSGAALKTRVDDAMRLVDDRMKPIVQRALMVGLEHWQKKTSSRSANDREEARRRVANIQNELIKLNGADYSFQANVGVAEIQGGTDYENIAVAKMNATKAAYLTRIGNGDVVAKPEGDSRVGVYDETAYRRVAIEAKNLRGELAAEEVTFHGRKLKIFAGGKINDELLTAVRKGKIDLAKLENPDDSENFKKLKLYYDLVNSMDFMTYAKGSELGTDVKADVVAAQAILNDIGKENPSPEAVREHAGEIERILSGRTARLDPDDPTTSQKGTASEAEFFNETVARGDRVLLAADMRGLGNQVFEANAAALMQVAQPGSDVGAISAGTSDDIIDLKRARIDHFREQYKSVLLPAAIEKASGRRDAQKILAILRAEDNPPLLLGGDEITVSLHPVFQTLGLVPTAVGFLTAQDVNARVAVARTGGGAPVAGHRAAMQAADPAQSILKDYEALAVEMYQNLSDLRGQDLENAQQLIHQIGGFYVTVKRGGGADLTSANGETVNGEDVKRAAHELLEKAKRARNER